MKRFIPAVLALSCLCCYWGPGAHSAPSSLVEKLSDSTAALVTESLDGDTKVFCSAVWIGSYTLLTAAHCVEADVDEGTNAIGQPIEYVTQLESNGVGEEPKAKHVAQVHKVDHVHDLALLKTGLDTPIHSSVLLGLVAPRVGKRLALLRAPIRLYVDVHARMGRGVSGRDPR
jgi:hypothetical protein